MLYPPEREEEIVAWHGSVVSLATWAHQLRPSPSNFTQAEEMLRAHTDLDQCGGGFEPQRQMDQGKMKCRRPKATVPLIVTAVVESHGGGGGGVVTFRTRDADTVPIASTVPAGSLLGSRSTRPT